MSLWHWLEHHFHSDVITAWFTVVLGAGTLLLAWITKRALATAEKDTREATKARIDSRSPQVVITPRDTAPSVAEWSIELPAQTPWVNVHPDTRLALASFFDVSNESDFTAYITIPPNSILFTNTEDRVAAMRRYAGSDELTTSRICPLAPRAQRLLYVEAALTSYEWMRRDRENVMTPVTTEVSIRDTFIDGVVDVIPINLAGSPLVGDGHEHWMTNPSPSVASVSLTTRNYRGLGA